MLRQVEACKRDVARLTHENNRLHQQQLQAADRSEQTSREQYKEYRARDSELAGLRFWKQNILQQFLALEQDNDSLKARLQELSNVPEAPTGTRHRGCVVSCWSCSACLIRACTACLSSSQSDTFLPGVFGLADDDLENMNGAESDLL